MSTLDPSMPRFGNWLTTNQCRNWDEVMVMCVKIGWRLTMLGKGKKRHQFEGQMWRNQRTRMKRRWMKQSSSSSNEQGYDEEHRRRVSTNQTTDALIENDMAIVLYNGGVLGEITNGMKGLGLKRNAEDRWGSSLSKEGRKWMKSSVPSDHFAYAKNARKSKARIRRNIVKKRKGDKENILEEETNLEDENMAIADEGSGDSGFIFKARRGRRKKISSEGSDHHALVVYCYYQERKGTRPFKFEANWVHHDNFLQIVENGWNEVEGTVDDRVAYLVRRLMACKQKLIAWSSKEFPNYRKVIAHLRHMLSCCHKGIMTAEKLVTAENLAKQIEEAWSMEESSAGSRPMEQALDYVKVVVSDSDNARLMEPIPLYVVTKMVARVAAIEKPSLWIATAEEYAEAGIRRIGYEVECSPYWSHSLQWYFASFLPASLLDSWRLYVALRRSPHL
ncbi:hypothetical protein K1719_037162 [Acacia pycnantha]|nr:hypothetical protein K1719_037162 [Acacia pycnantha]